MAFGSSLTLAEKMGFPSDSKLLIIHADDMGVSHSVNQATMAAFKSQSITSASVMLPCPWAYHAAEQIKDCSDCDVGVHITLNSEWKAYRWQPVSSFNSVASLVDDLGNLHSSPLATLKTAQVEHVAIEITGQILRAKALGLKLSHVDMHMGTVALKPEWLDAYVRASKQHGLIPMLVKWSPDLERYFNERKIPYDDIKKFLIGAEHKGELMLDRLVTDVGGLTSLNDRKKAYLEAVKSLKPGLTQMITHLSDDTPEFSAMTAQSEREPRRYWDSLILSDPEFKALLQQSKIVLTNWSKIREIKYASNELLQPTFLPLMPE